jgi:hypothetical protein
MSQRAVESVLGRLITDAEFRARFFSAPADLCRENDLPLTPQEARAILEIDLEAVQRLAIRLDPKIIRAVSVSPPAGATSRAPSIVAGRIARSAGNTRRA